MTLVPFDAEYPFRRDAELPRMQPLHLNEEGPDREPKRPVTPALASRDVP